MGEYTPMLRTTMKVTPIGHFMESALQSESTHTFLPLTILVLQLLELAPFDYTLRTAGLKAQNRI
jgi:hypothetical protein